MEVAGGSAGNNNGGREMTESSTSTLSNTSSLVGMMPSGYGGGGQHNHHKQQQQIYAIVQNQLRAIRSDVEQLRQQANVCDFLDIVRNIINLFVFHSIHTRDI